MERLAALWLVLNQGSSLDQMLDVPEQADE